MTPNLVWLYPLFLCLIALSNGFPGDPDLDDMEYDRDDESKSLVPKMMLATVVLGNPVPSVEIPNKAGEFLTMTREEVQAGKTNASSYETTEYVHCFLYRTNYTEDHQEFHFNELSSILAAGFKRSLPTVILVHGWLGSSESAVIHSLAKALLAQENLNVIAVDWEKGASTLRYDVARYRIPHVAKLVAKLIDNLVDGLGQDLDQIGIIGHSLGAHIAGVAAKRVWSGMIGYIVGLDPAAPLFRLSKPDERLSADDAQYVEVIHTNGNELGIFSKIGQADFYPNGGELQPGCGINPICNHERAVDIFIESLMTRDYYARRCDDITELGPSCSTDRTTVLLGGWVWKLAKPTGVYYLSTASDEPFLRSGTVELKSAFFWMMMLLSMSATIRFYN